MVTSLCFFRKILIPVVLGLAAVSVSPALEEDPVLKQDDVLRIAIFEEPELDANTRVLKSGSISLPLIGEVKVAGLTVSEAKKAIRDLYITEEYLADPKITLTVEEYSKDFISVIGNVRSAGQFPMPDSGKFDLAAALAMAGGLTPDADPNRIVITRADGRESTHSANSLQGGAVVPLYPGDRVRIDQSAFVNKAVTVLGPVGKAGPVPFPLDGRFDIVSAIASAGGFTELANPKKVSVNRKGKVTTLNVREITDKGDKPFALQPGDIITVAERLF